VNVIARISSMGLPPRPGGLHPTCQPCCVRSGPFACRSRRSSSCWVARSPRPAPQSSASTQGVSATPTPDAVIRTYVALIHNYWIQYKAAEHDPIGNATGQFDPADAARACYGLHDPATQDVQYIDPPICRERSAAMVAVHEKFLSDLTSTPAPPKFAADDHAFRSQLPRQSLT
jgi:hypothetical protein